MGDQSQSQTPMPVLSQQDQFATQPCPACANSIIVKIPMAQIVNLPNLLLIVAHPEIAECNSCGRTFQPVMAQAPIEYALLEVKHQDKKLIEIPGIDFSGLKIT